MKKFLAALVVVFITSSLSGQDLMVTGPDRNLKVIVSLKRGKPMYRVTYKEKIMLEESPLGFVSNIGDFSAGMTYVSHKENLIDKTYTQDRIKKSRIRYQANELTCTFANADHKKIEVVFRVSNHDIAFRYVIPKEGETGSCVIIREVTGFDFPSYTTTFLTPQSDAMIGWKRTKPSYEEEYKADAPLGEPSQYGHGYTFPCLFRIGNDGWVLVSETGVGSNYCASRLNDATDQGLYTLAFPMPEENNGNGTASPGLALPGSTPWRTLTVGETLKPIVETTIPWDVVEPLYETEHAYRFGRGTWSWILWQDNSINYDDQVKYIDLAAAMGYEYVLIDNWWDTRIGRERMKSLIEYARSKKVDVFLWYSSSGYWNDIEQGPVSRMDNPVIRKKEMKWLHTLGVKGIKVDFFGGDKQETMRLYEAILSDADDNGLMVIFHGCTLPRGWERMYPNYVGSEAVLASENLIFNQHFDDNEAFNACLHPFIRNTVGCMEFGGTLLNKRHNRTNDSGTVRKTTDIFQLATAVLFQNPIQNFALAPNNLTDVPAFEIDFMKEIPTTWDEIYFIDGYPGKYCVLGRRHDNRWYVVGINAEKKPLELKVKLPMFAGKEAVMYDDDKKGVPRMKNITVPENGEVRLVIQPQGGVIYKDLFTK
ncbi:glycoside hydrolase family 97 protein [Parabacteroides pacaensis]|uniref:glycoside hydrolase family 97 protein n=1 Tax=Parabacteroides pacaensis TaxID=2086575 RepID=UPI000D1138AA|nr:glycoside hydrolase family 97 protein [Parabacteroides pacaensis]